MEPAALETRSAAAALDWPRPDRVWTTAVSSPPTVAPTPPVRIIERTLLESAIANPCREAVDHDEDPGVADGQREREQDA